MSATTSAAEHVNAIRFERLAWRPGPDTWQRAAGVLAAVFVLAAPYLANVSRDYTRYCCFWRTSDTLCLLSLIVVLAGVWFAVDEAIRRADRPGLIRVADHVFLAVLGVGVLANAVFAASKLNHAAWTPRSDPVLAGWFVLAFVVGYSFGRPRSTLVHRCRQLCLIGIPVVPLTFGMLLLRSTYPDGPEAIPPLTHPCTTGIPKDARTGGGVYVFLFDEWSYERAFCDSGVRTEYPHVASFAGTATIYHDAHAPGECTETSLPGILLQTDEPVVVHNGRLGFERRQGSFAPAAEYQSVFARLRPLGYHSVMVGSTLPYRLWLQDQVDASRTYGYYPRGGDWTARLGVQLFNMARYSPDPFTRRSYKQLEQRLVHATVCGIIANQRSDIHTVIREWPAKTFLFAHVFPPHLPAVLDPDLTFRTPEQTGWLDGDLKQYERNLAAMDVLVGEFTDALRAAGKYDAAAIVLTADHSWRSDPDWTTGRRRGALTHVPLLVKAPRQQHAASVDARFETKDLGRLIESLVGRPTERDLLVMEDQAR
ncbi:MAG: sulfatase-like hydrolase/transferase [Planctomycetes bacterium]|nr:sulfatase-like hydrolase/transferase [Planctomycetota bacterium]